MFDKYLEYSLDSGKIILRMSNADVKGVAFHKIKYEPCNKI